MQTAKNLTPKAKEVIRQAGINIGTVDALLLSKLPAEQQADAAHQYVAGEITSISDYKPDGAAQKKKPTAPKLPVLVKPEPEDMLKPYSMPSASGENLTTAQTGAQLKSHSKDTSAAPWMFLETMTQFAENFCREITGYLDGTYACLFPDLNPDQMRYLRERLDRIIAAADKFYQYVEGENDYV